MHWKSPWNTIASVVRLPMALILLFLLAGTFSRGQTVMPQVLTLNLTLPSPKNPNEGYRLPNSYAYYRELGPIRTNSQFRQQPVQRDYLFDPNLRYIPWQFNNVTLGMPGFTPMQRLAIALPPDLESVYRWRPLAPTKVRRSRSAPEQ